MRNQTKFVAYGALGIGVLGALGVVGYAVTRAIRRRKSEGIDIDSLFDTSDLEDPMIVSEEVVVFTEPTENEADLDLIAGLTTEWPR